MGFMSENGGEKYNLCHCESHPLPFLVTMNSNGEKKSVWSNFEVADMNFWRGPAYTAFFEYLDSKGGFYYEVRSVLSPWIFNLC